MSAKDSSQETLVNLMALIFNIMILSYVKDSKSLIWQLFVLFVLGHLFANYKAVKAVVMRTFNRNRFHILLNSYFETASISDPRLVNMLEPVLCSVSRQLSNLNFGCHINELKDTKLLSSMNRFDADKFIIEFDMKSKHFGKFYYIISFNGNL